MKIVFISNYFNHHQQQVADELFRLTEGEYRFFATEKMSEERKNLGWSIALPSYVVEVGKTLDEERQRQVDEADVVILGGEPYAFVKNRLKQGKLTFLYSERLFKKKVDFLRRIKAMLVRRPRWRKKNAYLLCAGGFVAADFQKTGCFRRRAYRWGYFPPFYPEQNGEKVRQRKKENSLLYCARLIDWKHPELAVELAERLKEAGYEFSLQMVGGGELQEETARLIKEKGLEDRVTLVGSVPFEEVRKRMLESEILLFTSDRQEGWGAVLGEGMNARMAVVASHEIGATPYLVKDKENGLVFESGNVDDLYAKVKALLDDADTRKRIGEQGYQTIEKEWNGQIAARRLLALIEALQKGEDTPFAEGVCSRAPVLKEDWLKRGDKV